MPTTSDSNRDRNAETAPTNPRRVSRGRDVAPFDAAQAAVCLFTLSGGLAYFGVAAMIWESPFMVFTRTATVLFVLAGIVLIAAVLVRKSSEHQ